MSDFRETIDVPMPGELGPESYSGQEIGGRAATPYDGNLTYAEISRANAVRTDEFEEFVPLDSDEVYDPYTGTIRDL